MNIHVSYGYESWVLLVLVWISSIPVNREKKRCPLSTDESSKVLPFLKIVRIVHVFLCAGKIVELKTGQISKQMTHA
jgi:hypothetical protein